MKKSVLFMLPICLGILALSCNQNPVEPSIIESTTDFFLYNYDSITYEVYVNGQARGSIQGKEDSAPAPLVVFTFKARFYENDRSGRERFNVDIRSIVSGTVIIFDQTTIYVERSKLNQIVVKGIHDGNFGSPNPLGSS